jgi:UDP-2,4-diacetamido-2,4,6-trideoxy-beta-L-altropyranose hydrolase
MKVVIRADANPTIGIGHFTRSLTLARGLVSNGHDVEMQTKCENSQLLQNAKAHGINVTQIPHSESGPFLQTGASNSRADWGCLDGYHFTTPDYSAARKFANKLLVIDDSPRKTEYPVDLILDHNYGATLHRYPSPDALQLLGSTYALIRPEIATLGDKSHSPSRLDQRSIVVTFGGSDPAGATEQTVEALSKLSAPNVEITVVAGPANSRIEHLQQLCTARGFIFLVNPPELPEILATADLAICGAGTTIWELMCLSVPVLAITIAENQIPAARSLAQDNLIAYLGKTSDLTENSLADQLRGWLLDTNKLEKMAARSAEHIDGRGPSRVIAKLQELSGSRKTI